MSAPPGRGVWAPVGALVVMALLTAGCRWGVSAWQYPPAVTPSGAQVAVRVVGEDADRLGELYAVDSVGLTIRSERLVRIGWSRVAAMDVAFQNADYDVLWEERVSAAKRQRLSLVSRYPQGLQGDLLVRVLRSLRQDALEEVR